MSLFLPICLRKKKKNKLSTGAPWLKEVPSSPCPSAFTLIELLIAVSIFSVVSIAIYSTFASGTAVLRKVKNVDFAQQKTLLKIQRLSQELREQPNYRKKLFSGTSSKIVFCGQLNNFPCRLTYYFDKASTSFLRAAEKWDQIITDEGNIDKELKVKPVVFLSKVKDVKFEYLYLDLTKNEYKWAEDWEFDYLPLAVKFTLTDDNKEYVSTVFLSKDL